MKKSKASTITQIIIVVCGFLVVLTILGASVYYVVTLLADPNTPEWLKIILGLWFLR